MADAPSPAAPLDPQLAALLAQVGGAAPQQQLTLDDIIRGSVLDVTGRKGMGGQPITYLPSWMDSGIYAKLESSLGPNDRKLLDPFLGLPGQEDDRVFFGSEDVQVEKNKPLMGREYAPDGQAPAVTGTEAQDQTKTVSAAMNMPFLWDQDKINSTIEKMNKAGITVNSFDDMMKVWQGMVGRASAMYSLSAGDKKVTPWDVLDMYKSEAKASGLDPNRSEMRTVSSVNELTEGQSWQALRGTLQQLLGRDPSDQELRDYTYRMNSLAAKNPSITKTITQYKNNQAVSAHSTTEGGFTTDDALMAAYDDAQSNPDYAEYQAGSTYYNAALQAIGAIGQS